MPVERILLPAGEAAKRLAVIESAAGELARLRVERTEPLIAVGGGALGDAAGFLAATWLRGVPLVHVPTTLVAQIDSSIGGKTAVDLAEGKNLVGAFHQPAAILIDVELIAGLPERQRRAALGEAVKMAALGDEAAVRAPRARRPRGSSGLIRRSSPTVRLAELVERCVWAKVEVVLADERESGGRPAAAGIRGAAGRIEAGRLALNLGHSLGHGFEAAAGYGDALLHGEAVAYGLRAACRIGLALGRHPERIGPTRIERAPDRPRPGSGRRPGPARARSGCRPRRPRRRQEARRRRLRWVLPTADDVDDSRRRPGRARRSSRRRAPGSLPALLGAARR